MISKMSDEYIKNIQELVELMKPHCNKEACKGTECSRDIYRCCDLQFCKYAEEVANSMGVDLSKYVGRITEITYMGKDGCLVPPELRPMCSTFCCVELKRNKKFHRQYMKLMSKIKPEMDRLTDNFNPGNADAFLHIRSLMRSMTK